MVPSEIIFTAEKIVELYIEKKLTLALAESCTGGLVAANITSVSGASVVFDRGFVTYSNDAKQEMLGVPPALIAQHGAVSAECAQAMAEGARAKSKADIGLSITGIAGPGGGTPDKPVGLVYIGLSTAKESEAKRFMFEGTRDNIRRQSVVKALAWLLATGKEK